MSAGVTYPQSALLGALQGLTEFLPKSGFKPYVVYRGALGPAALFLAR